MGEGEGEVCVAVAVAGNGMMEIDNLLRPDFKCEHQLTLDVSETVPCAREQVKETSANPEIDHCNGNEFVEPFKGAETELEIVPIKQVKEARSDADIDHCIENESLEALEVGKAYDGPAPMEQVEETVNSTGPCRKNEVKEVSNDDVFSEVSNPNLSPRYNTSSFQTITSQRVDLEGNNQVICGEITSSYSGNSSTEETSSDDENSRDAELNVVPKSCVVLEIPKQFSTTGIRKITFKFSKRKEDYNDQFSASAAMHMINGHHEGFHQDLSQDICAVSDINAERNLINLAHGTGNPLLFAPNTEQKMSKKVVPDYPTNVKSLLTTRILEGARVKYVSNSGQRVLDGFIKDCGYLCGCSLCNFSKVLSAYEFELHAGGKSRHPNNHIYLENGKPIYNIIEGLKTASLSMLDELMKDVAGSSINERYFHVWKANLQRSYDMIISNENHHPGPFKSSHSSSSYPCKVPILHGVPFNHQRFVETAEEQKRVVKKPRSYSPYSFTEPKKTVRGGVKKRDNDLHRLLFMPNGLPNGTDLAYYIKGKKILAGYKQGNGIVCSCCHAEISPSQFEAHAGWASKRQPYRHIYTSSGLTLHDIALMLANGQTIATNNSDDMCTVCGDGGELIICEACPRAFHAACLGLQCRPAIDWRCPYCPDKFGKRVAGEKRPIIVRHTRVVRAPVSEVGGCVVCRSPDFSSAGFDDRTVLLCDQCEKEYHVGCLRESGLCNLTELPMDKWFCCEECNNVFVALHKYVSGGSEIVPASVSARISMKHAEKGLADVAADDIQWRIMSGKSRYPEHLPFLSRAAAIFRECFDPIVAKSGRDLIPVMVYGRNISGQEFGGMYCVVLIVKSVVVSAGLIRVFGQEVAEIPLVATSRENQGKGYFHILFLCIERLLASMNVKILVLPAAEEAESLWTKRFGFRKMTDDRSLKYTRDFQLTAFKGTSMLEKEVQPVDN